MRARHPWWLPLAAAIGASLVRVVGATWRYTVSDAPEYTAALARGERFVYAFWHSALLPGAVLHRDEGIAVLVSRHRDGELITRIIERLGYVTARGSSTRGGDAGVRGMLAWAGRDRHLAVTPDGPRGPAEQVKPGVLYLAERTGRRLVPIAIAARPVRALKSWDRFRVPWPFARVLVTHGAPFDPAASPSAEAAGTRGATPSDPAVSPSAETAGTRGATPSAETAGIRGAFPADALTGVPSVPAGSNECAGRELERRMAALSSDVRERLGERL